MTKTVKFKPYGSIDDSLRKEIRIVKQITKSLD